MKTALTQAQPQVQGSKFFLFLVLALTPAFALQQVKTKCRSDITQAQGSDIYQEWLCLANENTRSSLPPLTVFQTGGRLG